MYAAIVINLLVIQLFICKSKYQYIITPPILLGLMWIAVHFLNLLLGWQTNEIEYLILAIPPVMFTIGFGIISRYDICFGRYHIDFGKYGRVGSEKKDTGFSINYRILYGVLAIDIALMLWSLKLASAVISKLTNANYWLNVHESASMVEGNIIVSYSVPMSYMFSGVCGLLYSKQKNRRMRLIYIGALLCALIRAFMAGNRTSLAMVFVINLFPILIGMKDDSGFKKGVAERKTRRLIVFGALVFAVMFFGIASQKYSEQFTNLSRRDFFVNNFTGYFNLSSAAFVKWYQGGFVHTNGANTFRFFYALLSRLGMPVPVADTNAQYISIEGTVTNAFTVVKPYVEDYGVIYMAGMLLVIGMLHAHFYKKAFSNDFRKKLSGQMYCGVMYIGLLYQVLSDQYVMILSMMINFYIWSYIFPRILLRPVKREVNSVGLLQIESTRKGKIQNEQ